MPTNLAFCQPQEGFITPTYLITHPIFKKLKWPVIFENGLFLYQKNLEYKSISDFVSNYVGNLITENTIAKTRTFNSGVNIEYLEQIHPSFIDQKINQPGFILSSFEKPRTLPNNWSEFSRVISLQGIEINSQNQITFKITSIPESEIHPEIKITSPQIEFK